MAQGKVGKGPRYAVYDFNYDLSSGEGTRYVIRVSETCPELTHDIEARLHSSHGPQMMPEFRYAS